MQRVHCVDLDESFQTHIYLQNLASIQPRTSPLKLGSPPLGRGGDSSHTSRWGGTVLLRSCSPRSETRLTDRAADVRLAAVEALGALRPDGSRAAAIAAPPLAHLDRFFEIVKL